jgi:hypothetical protein
VPFATALHDRIDALGLEVVKEALHLRGVQTISLQVIGGNCRAGNSVLRAARATAFSSNPILIIALSYFPLTEDASGWKVGVNR